MKVLSVVGPGADAAADRIVARLSSEGRVARVDRVAGVDRADPDGGVLADSGAATTYRLDEEGWAARGDGLDLAGALDALAPDHDYAVAVGFPDASFPTAAVGDAGLDDAALDAPAADALDPDDALAVLADAEPHETLGSLVARVEESPDADRAGAVATFTGRVRERDGEDDPRTTRLEFEKYEGVAEERMDAIAADLEDQEGVLAVAMHHRTGVVEAGEDIVFVVVLAGHRAEAFRAVEDGIDRLKEEVPIFKKEVTVEEEFWVHDGADDTPE